MKGQTITKTIITTGLLVITLTVASLGFGARKAFAACAAPSTDYGKVTINLSVPGTATYRIWSRIMVPNSTNKSFLLEVDGGNCYNVGGGSIPTSSWTWVDYQSGSTSNKVQLSLNQGNHSLKLIGNAPDVKVDRVIALSDLACVPTGQGDNCNVPSDTTPPSVTLTAPIEGATVSGNVSLTATASDNVGVSKVEFYDNSSLVATDTSSPYAATLNTAAIPNGTHLITARAYDAAGNISADSNSVTTKNGDTQAPSTPGNVKASAASYNTVNVSWTASTDNVGVTGYTIFRDGVPIGNVGKVTSYTNTGLSPHTTYSFQVQAFDAAGNKSASSTKTTVTTPTVADAVAPSKPTNLAASAVSQTQINVSWTASTDNIGVTSYDVYRSTGSDTPQKVGTSATPSFGDSNLSANTEYTYYVIAKDASNNASQPSDEVTAKTLQLPPPSTRSNIKGRVTSADTHKPLPSSRVTINVDGHRRTYQADQFGRYAIFNVKTGRYNLTFRAKGYHSKTIAVQLNDTTLTQNVVLKKKK